MTSLHVLQRSHNCSQPPRIKMKTSSPKVLVAAGFPDKLRKRERAGMATAYAMAKASNAFSVCFDFKPRHVRTIIYLQQPAKAERQVDLDPDEDDDREDDDEGDAPAQAPASAGTVRAPPPPKTPAPPQKAPKKAEAKSTPSKPTGTLTHAKGPLSGGTPKARVEKNALSARGSPSGSRPPHAPPKDDDPMGEHGGGNTSKKPIPTTRFKPYEPGMFMVKKGPPPAGLTEHGTWNAAQAAGVDYGDPNRRVWIRNSDGRMWEADDGDHLRGGDS